MPGTALKVGSLLYVGYAWGEVALRALSSDKFGNWVPANLALLIVMGTATAVLWRLMPAIEISQDPTGGSEPDSTTAPPVTKLHVTSL